ncbi:MAG TPA: UDP-N-acetylmuramoyl-tripeptide--D-alanyl-D-alanine ligase [Sediminispirochaeta sp.]|nr:UDP-N-acetylmuramoyl-tripeptide--D-alanyl-D-alanine ligase [Sediminispirochaeta sp.]
MDRLFTLAEAREMTRFELAAPVDDLDARDVVDVQVDSRKVSKGSLFIALPGQMTDGHRFLSQAAASGSAALAVNRRWYEEEGQRRSFSIPVLVVEDTLTFLQDLAAAWLGRSARMCKIGITGSNGKTTTKEIVYAILNELGPTVKNEGNLNSEIGLPLAAFGARSSDRFGVFEMGVNHPGEMDQMVRVLRPSCALINNIGTAHIGLLGGREGIAREKGRLFEALPRDGRGFIPEKFQWSEYYHSISAAPLSTFGPESTEGVTRIEGHGLSGWSFDYFGERVRLNLPGRHNLLNALGAISLTRYVGAGVQEVVRGLAKVAPVTGRSQVIDGALRIVQDAYNANAESVAAMLETLAEEKAPEKIVLVIGAMKELGAGSEEAHRSVGARICELDPRAVFLFGQETAFTKDELERRGFEGRAVFETDFEQLSRKLLDTVQPGDTVLLKGSRSMKLERLIPLLDKFAAKAEA